MNNSEIAHKPYPVKNFCVIFANFFEIA